MTARELKKQIDRLWHNEIDMSIKSENRIDRAESIIRASAYKTVLSMLDKLEVVEK